MSGLRVFMAIILQVPVSGAVSITSTSLSEILKSYNLCGLYSGVRASRT